jgi:hypothetical protein
MTTLRGKTTPTEPPCSSIDALDTIVGERQRAGERLLLDIGASGSRAAARPRTPAVRRYRTSQLVVRLGGLHLDRGGADGDGVVE